MTTVLLTGAILASALPGCEVPVWRQGEVDYDQPTPMERSPSAEPPVATAEPLPASAGPRQRMDAAYDHIYANRYTEAIAILEPMTGGLTPRDSIGAEVLLWLGWCRQELGQRSAARLAYTRVITDYPDSRYAALARRYVQELE
jgi:hypothetical protein